MKARKLLLWGILTGLIAAALAYFGNPKNMAICIACFVRDISGSLKLHQAAAVQYFRPEIVGFVLGSFIISIAKGEFRSTAGSSPMIRFFLAMAMMIGALVFLGCPTRMVLRMASGEISAWIGMIGFVGGVATGIFFLKKGYSLGRSQITKKGSGLVFPVIFALAFAATLVFPQKFAFSESGPGSFHAPWLISLAAGIAIGVIAQRIRMCFAGGVRDAILIKNFDLFSIVVGIFLSMTVYNAIQGEFVVRMFGPVAHAQHLWNILGLYVVGFSSILLGGCPLRQLILMGQGSSDSGVAVLGMLVGAAVAHNFGFAASPAAAATAEAAAVAGGPGVAGMIAVVVCIVFLFAVGIHGTKREA
jgi:YedE family putative selenium metabolism protein